MSIVHIAGRLGRDAELKHVKETDVCNFSVAETIGFGDRKQTQWWSCALWGSRGEKLAQYLTKGTAVTVCGEVTTREYTGKDGLKFELQCRVLEVTLQGSREGGDQEKPAATDKTPQQQKREETRPTGSDGFGDEEIPFAHAWLAPLAGLLLAGYAASQVLV